MSVRCKLASSTTVTMVSVSSVDMLPLLLLVYLVAFILYHFRHSDSKTTEKALNNTQTSFPSTRARWRLLSLVTIEHATVPSEIRTRYSVLISPWVIRSTMPLSILSALVAFSLPLFNNITHGALTSTVISLPSFRPSRCKLSFVMMVVMRYPPVVASSIRACISPFRMDWIFPKKVLRALVLRVDSFSTKSFVTC